MANFFSLSIWKVNPLQFFFPSLLLFVLYLLDYTVAGLSDDAHRTHCSGVMLSNAFSRQLTKKGSKITLAKFDLNRIFSSFSVTSLCSEQDPFISITIELVRRYD